MTNLILVISDRGVVSDAELFEIDCLFPNELIAIIAEGIGKPPSLMRLMHIADGGYDLSSLESLFEGVNLSAIILRPGSFPNIPKSVLNSIMSRSMPQFYQFEGRNLEPYIFDDRVGRRVVFIYPGIFVPMKNGSTQRAFNLVLGLMSKGHQVDVIIPHARGAQNFKEFLTQFGIGVHVFRPSRLKFLIDFLRDASRRTLGLQYYLPYFARLRFSISSDFKACIQSTVKAGDAVIATYAWMSPDIKDRKDDIDLILDTHDVNFVRDKSYYRSARITARLLAKFNKRLEIRTLNRADRILAISEADKAIFDAEQLDVPVTLLEPSFEWIDAVSPSDKEQASSFGFIGSNMVANRMAIDEILDNVWPNVQQLRPEASLFIAGSICEHLKDRESLGKNVVSLGFVTSVQDYFAEIDALLSPVLMQGGLNFKIIESLCCGVPVLVNSEATHLKKLSPLVYVYDGPRSIQQFLSFADEIIRSGKERARQAELFRQKQADKFYLALDGALRK